MKKVLVVVAAAALALALAGCGSNAASSSANSASASSESASASSSASSESTQTLTWTEEKTAENAAKTAGIDELIVPKAGTKISLGDLGEWAYYSADKMAEADGGAAAAEIVIRKSIGNGDNTAGSGAVTGAGRDLSEATYAAEWSVDMDGTDVRCYGSKKGTVSKAIWEDGKYSYSILVLGQGDNWQEFGVPEDDIAVLVKGTKKTEVKEEKKSEESQSSQDSDNYDELVSDAVFDNGLGELVSYSTETDANGNLVFEIVTRGADGKEYSSVLDADGNVLENGYIQANSGAGDGNPNLTEADIQNIIWENGLGEFVSAEFQPSDGDTVDAWRVITHDANGKEVVVFVDDETGGYEIL